MAAIVAEAVSAAAAEVSAVSAVGAQAVAEPAVAGREGLYRPQRLRPNLR